MEHLLIFWFNEYKVKFEPSHGSVFLFDATLTIHGTISTTRDGAIGIALVQKIVYITNLWTIVDNPTTEFGKYFLIAKNYEYEKIIPFLKIF